MSTIAAGYDIITDLATVCSEIDCIILRGYIPITELSESKDVDVLVAKEQSKEIGVVLSALGWEKVTPNCFRYPHVMFRKTDGNGHSISVDVVNDLYFGKDLFHQTGARIALNSKRETNGIYVAAPKNALIIFMLHVVYDKRELSVENKRRMISFLELCESDETPPEELISDVFFRGYVLPAAKVMTSTSDANIINQQFQLIIFGAGENCILKYNMFRRIYRHFTQYINFAIRKATSFT